MKGFLTGPFGIVVMVTIGVGMLAAIEGFHYVRSAAHLGRVVGVFALLGLFLGVIYATDPRDGFAVRDRPIARTVLSFAIGCSLAAAFSSGTSWVLPCGATFGVLGWFGMRWAKYVDF